MPLLLALSPFICFFLLEHLVGIRSGLLAATALSAILAARWMLAREPRAGVLELASLALFGGLTAYVTFVQPDWSMTNMRLIVDSGLFLVMAVSILLGQPFTLRYAAARVTPQQQLSPRFLRANYLVSAAWALALLIIIAADTLAYFHPQARYLSLGIIILSAWSAICFGVWYPRRQLRRN